MKISLVLLTMNRGGVVQRSLMHNLRTAGHPIDEIIHVDNGSTDWVKAAVREFKPTTSIYFSENKGVAKGYNAGMQLATGSHVLITGCDRFMPNGWLKILVQYQRSFGGIGCIYSKKLSEVPERVLKEKQTINGFPIVEALPMEARIFPRLYLKRFGYFREDFGLYGHEDLEWSERFLKHRLSDLSYVIPGLTARHEGSEGINDWNGVDDKDYHEMKRRESLDPTKQEKLKWCRSQGHPIYFPE